MSSEHFFEKNKRNVRILKAKKRLYKETKTEK